MKRRCLALALVILALTAVMMGLVYVAGLAGLAWAASPEQAPTIIEVDPASAPNDLDSPIVITGTGFAAVPTVTLGSMSLEKVGWVTSATLTATVPWGLDPGVYTMTVTNPGGESGVLPGAYTVTQGIGLWNAGELYGGSVGQVVVNPLTPTTLYASIGFGLFRSRDGAANWSYILAATAQSLALDPLAPSRIYMQGEPHHAGSFLWRSDDEGETWIPLTVTHLITPTGSRDCSVRYRIYPISETTYLASCGADDDPSGVITSTDHGESWWPAMGGLTDTQVTALAWHPTDPLTMYLGTASGNVFLSHNGGVSWTYASSPVAYVHDLVVNPFEPNEVWVVADSWLGEPCGILKSTSPDLTAWQWVLDSCAEVFFSPSAWGQVYSGTVFLSDGYRSTDGGSTWLPFGPEGWIHDMAFHPTDPGILWVGEGGETEGLYKTTDGGSTWQVANHGLTGIVPELQILPDQPEVVYGLSMGKIYRGTRGGDVWQRLPISRVQTFLIDPVTPTRIYAGVDEGVRISDDGGYSWPTFAPLGKPPEYADCGLWPRALSPAPQQPGTLLAGVRHFGWTAACVNAHGSIYTSADHGASWTRLDLGQEISQVNDIVCDPADPAVLYASTGNENGAGSGMLKSIDSGAVWESVGEGQLEGSLTDIEIEPEGHRVYVLMDAMLPLFVSTDGGANWVATGSIDTPNVNDILAAPYQLPMLYAATGQGLYRSIDGAQSWQRAAGVLGQVPVWSLDAVSVDERLILYASTTGGDVEGGAARASSQANAEGTLVTAGVYRFTTVRHWWVYLPLVARQR